MKEGSRITGSSERNDSAARRRMVVLFTDLSDSTLLSEVLEGEDYAVMLDQLARLFAESVERHGGTVNQWQGDGFQALFGYPEAGETDGANAVEAALDMHEAVRRLEGRFGWASPGVPSVHSGVHAGRVLTRDGSDLGARIELFGPAPGLAKHLSDVADPDEILVSAETLGPASHLFVLSRTREVLLKGRKQPVSALSVTSRSGLRTRFQAHVQRGLVPFLGRQSELRRLGQAMERARHGHTAFVAVIASVGVGKTRLAEECLRRAEGEGWRVWRGFCDDGLRAEPLQAFLQMLRGFFGVSVDGSVAQGRANIERVLAQEDAGLLCHLPILRLLLCGEAENRLPDSATALAAIVDVVTCLAVRRPLLLFIDDWQWADLSTRQLVHLIHQRAGLPLMLLVTTRPLDQGELALLAGAEHVEIGPFNDEETRATVRRLLPQADPFVTDAILKQSGGNALYVEELCHAAVLDGRSVIQDVHLGRSVWLETLIESRVARLPPTQFQLLHACAVIGNPAPTWLLRGLTGCKPDDPQLRALADADLLFQDGAQALRFKHGITQEVVYSRLGLHERRALHRQVASLIHARAGSSGELEACEALAFHFSGAGECEAAARFAHIAGDKALAGSALSQARAQYLLALDMLDRQPSQAGVYRTWRAVVRRLGFVCVFDPLRADLPRFDRAIARATEERDRSGLAYAHYWRAYLLYALGDLKSAVRAFDLSHAAAAEVQDPLLHAQLRSTRGQALAAAADYSGALSLLEETARLPAQGSGSASGLAFTLACRGSVLGDMGRFDEALACIDAALQALPHDGHEVHGSVLCWRSGVLLWQGRWREALLDAEAAQRVGARVSSLYLLSMSQALGAFARWQLGGGTAALRDLCQAADWLETRDKRLYLSLVHGWLAYVLDAHGHVQKAREQAIRALARRRQRDWIGAAMAARVLAYQAARTGAMKTAWRHLRRAERAAAVRASAHEAACNALCWAMLLAADGDVEAARSSRDLAICSFARLGMTWHLDQARHMEF